MGLAKLGLSGRTLVIAVPVLWLFTFFLAPFLVVAQISLAEAIIARPPYTPLLEWVGENRLEIRLNFENYLFLFEDPLYFKAYLSSIRIALISTLLTLLVGYPIAYYIARSSERMRLILLLGVILPFWTSFLLRVYAWIGLLKENGIVNDLLVTLGLVDKPLIILQTNTAVYVGIVYTYLPFMILPLYANLARLSKDLREASVDLGAPPLKTFLFITLPLSLPGIIAGSMLVFVPVIGEFVIPSLLGGPDTLMIGRILWDEFFGNRDWPVASAVAVVMLMLVVIPVMLLRNVGGQSRTAA